MKRIALAVSLALAVFAWSGMSMTAPVSAQDTTTVAAAVPNVTGDWKLQLTGDRFVVGTLHLTHVGDTLVGSAEAPNSAGITQFTGHFKGGGQVDGTFRGPTGETGWITLMFQSDTTMSGEWGYHGRTPNGHIVAQKIKATDF